MSVTLYDAYGRPIDLKALKTEQAAPTTAGVRRNDAHHPAAGLTPGKLARVLKQSIDGDPEPYLALAEDIEERDNHYLGVLGIRKSQVAGLPVTVVAAGEDEQSVAHADLVRDAIQRPGFYDELIDILDAVGKGFSCTEILWETSERDWRPRRLVRRDPRWFRFDQTDGETPLLRDIGGDQPLRPYQWIFHTGKAKSGIPIRGGLARAVAWSFFFKSFTVKDWAIFCEAYGQPLRLGKYDAGASEADKDKLLTAVSNIGADYAAIVPQSMAIEFIKADLSGSHELYEKRADWLDRQVSKAVLGQTATTDAIAGGHAVGKTHDRVRDDIEKADSIRLSDTLTRDFAHPLVTLNHGPQKRYPTVVVGRPEEIDLEKYMANVDKFVRLGGRVAASVVADKIGVPEADEGEELLRPPTSAAHAPVEPEKPVKDVRAAASNMKPGTAPQPPADAIDSATAEILQDWEPLIAPLVAGLQEEIAAATSLEEVEALLKTRFATMDVAQLTNVLARAAFAARLSGEADESLT